MQHEEITRAIIGCAYRVYNTLGFGFLESVYERSLLIELRKGGLRAEAQVPITVYYDGQSVGDFVVDVLVAEAVVVELKSVQQLATTHEVQLVNYLAATRLDVGLLLNFGPTKVDVKRKLRTLSDQSGESLSGSGF
jgi:GxxExxY protein